MTDEHARDHRGRFVFVTDCEVFAGADDPRGHILMQVDARTYRRASGEDLVEIEKLRPGLIGRLPRYFEGDVQADEQQDG